MYYNYTGIENFTGLLTFFNTVTQDVFWTLALLGTFITIVIILSRWNLEDAFLSASFICVIFGTLLRVLGLVGNAIIVLLMLVTALLGAFKLFFKQN